jgi:uncharacterized protein YggE
MSYALLVAFVLTAATIGIAVSANTGVVHMAYGQQVLQQQLQLPPSTHVDTTELLHANANLTVTGEHTISLSSTASMRSMPDKAAVELTVTTRAVTAQEALENNTQISQDVTAALKRIGIPENETETANFDVSPTFNYTSSPPVIVGYVVRNSITVTTSNITSLGTIIDAAVGAGANGVNSVTFSFSDEKMTQIKDTLLHSAVAKAKKSADSIARDLGVHVTDVQSISATVSGNEGSSSATQNNSANAAKFALRESVSAPPIITTNEQTISVTVSVVFVINKT